MSATTPTQGALLTAYVLTNGTQVNFINNVTSGGTPGTGSIASNTTFAPITPAANNELRAISIILIIMYIPFLLVAAFGNATVIIVRLRKFKQSGLSAYKQLICHLSLADIIYSTAIPLDIYLRIKKKHWIEHTSVCKILTTTQSASLTASVCILTVMAFERFQGISNPLAHHWSTKKVRNITVIVFLVHCTDKHNHFFLGYILPPDSMTCRRSNFNDHDCNIELLP